MAARTGKAALAGVIGFPVGHSLSPALHEYWLRHYDIDGAYIPLRVPPGTFKDSVNALMNMNFKGANVTIPHKEHAFELCDSHDGFARYTGAVNTLVFQKDGHIHGQNTDTYGFMESLLLADIDAKDIGHALILGAGGAARAIAVSLLHLGIKELTIANRTRSNAELLAKHLHQYDDKATIHIEDWETRDKPLSGCGMVVNTTQLGMKGQPELTLALEQLPAGAAVVDIVYNPLKTSLINKAEQLKLSAIPGLPMLIYQAVPAFEAWFGIRPDVTDTLREMLERQLDAAPC